MTRSCMLLKLDILIREFACPAANCCTGVKNNVRPSLKNFTTYFHYLNQTFPRTRLSTVSNSENTPEVPSRPAILYVCNSKRSCVEIILFISTPTWKFVTLYLASWPSQLQSRNQVQEIFEFLTGPFSCLIWFFTPRHSAYESGRSKVKGGLLPQ